MLATASPPPSTDPQTLCAAFSFEDYENEVEGQEYHVEGADAACNEVEKIIKKWKNARRRTQRLTVV